MIDSLKEMISLKILHTSDWHLGKSVFMNSMLEEQRYFIDNVFLPALYEHKPDVIVLAGDIYDRSIAPIAAIELFEQTLYSIAERSIPLIAISGNHDSAERIIPASKLMRKSGIYLANSINDFFNPIDIEASDKSRARFFPLPYFDISSAKYAAGCDEIKNQNEAYKKLFEMNTDKLSKDCPNILITHCTVTGAITCDSENEISVGGAQQVSSELFRTFDFTCLGHIHSPQKAGKNVMYSGSPLRYSFDTNEQDKSMLLIDTNNNMSITKIPIAPLHEMRCISGTFEELLNVPDNSTEDYIFALVNDDKLIYEPMSRLRIKYPNILGLNQTYLSRISTASSNRNDIREKMANHSITDDEIFTGFLRDICRTEPNQDDLRLFNEIRQHLDYDEKEDTAQ